MKFINRIGGILGAIPYRLIAHWELALASVFGLVVSLSLILSIPLYADAVYYRALKKTITDDSEFGVKYRPPFSFLFHYYGGWSGNLTWEGCCSCRMGRSWRGKISPASLGLRHFVVFLGTMNLQIACYTESGCITPRTGVFYDKSSLNT